MLEERRRQLFFLDRELDNRREIDYILRQLSELEIDRLTLPILLPSVIEWPPERESGIAIIELDVYIPMLRSHARSPCKDLTRIAKYRNLRRDLELGIRFECMTLGPYRFFAQTETIRLPPRVFERYAHLQREIESISGLLPNDAIERVATLQLRGLRGSNPRILGTTVRGEHIGFVGPALISIVQFYLLLMLYLLLHSVQRGSISSSFCPWVVLMQGPVAKWFSIVTLVFLPTIAASTPAWRLTTADWYLPIVIAIVLLAFGIRSVLFGQQIVDVIADEAVHSASRCSAMGESRTSE